MDGCERNRVLFCQLLYYWFSQDVRNNAARSSSVVSSGPRETVTRPNARTLTMPTLAVARRAPGAAQPEDVRTMLRTPSDH